MGENTDLTYYQRNRDLILNQANDFYENNKERLREHAIQKIKEINTEAYLKKKKVKKKRECEKNRYHNISEEKKQRIKEYQKNYYKTKKVSI